jgi:HAD superfamily hydrolase (TIGR01549 family)
MSPAIDWASVRLVVFDLDGTLYEQRPVRLGMAGDLVRHCVKTRSLRDFQLVRAYRKLREELAEGGAADFMDELHARLGRRYRLAPDEVAALAEEWLERRPLARLPKARIHGADSLFAALRRSGRRVGVWSDYPVAQKLASLGLEADYVCAATDPDIRRLKPDPTGLLMMLERAGVAPTEALMIGDRPERDGEAARRAGVPFLLRTKKRVDGHHCAADYRDALFASVL